MDFKIEFHGWCYFQKKIFNDPDKHENYEKTAKINNHVEEEYSIVIERISGIFEHWCKRISILHF